MSQACNLSYRFGTSRNYEAAEATTLHVRRMNNLSDRLRSAIFAKIHTYLYSLDILIGWRVGVRSALQDSPVSTDKGQEDLE